MKVLVLVLLLSVAPFIVAAQSHSLLANIGSGEEHGIIAQNQATNWNGKSYFISNDAEFFQNGIWSTDGTSANTKPVPNTDNPEIEFLTSVDNYLIFNGYGENHRSILRSDGTPSGTEVIMEFPSNSIVFMEAVNNTTVVFITENNSTDSTYLWSTDGTANGTINLGYFEIKPDFLRVSYYGSSMIFTEKSTNFNFFPPVITDGTIEGTRLVTDYINEILVDDIANVTSAVGTTDFIFVNTSNGNKKFDGISVDNFNLPGDFLHGFKLGQHYVLFSNYSIALYDSLDDSGIELFIQPDYFTEPVANNGNVFFHDIDGYVYRTDGTPSSIEKISSVTAGSLNFEPYLFATEDVLLYSTIQGNATELWIVDLNTNMDSLFSTVKLFSSNQLKPYAFSEGDKIIYARNTAVEGYEYWVYSPLETGLKNVSDAIKLVMSPNPADNELTITFDHEISLLSRLSIYSSTGQLMWNTDITGGNIQVDLSGYSAGQYFIQLDGGNGSQYGGSFVKK